MIARAEDVSKLLKRAGVLGREAVRRGVVRASEHARARLVDATPVDTGELRKSWINAHPHEPNVLGLVHNHAPHAGVVEHGRAKGRGVSREGFLALVAWAVRHELGSGKTVQTGPNAGLDAGAVSIAWLIARKYKEEGQAPTYFVRELLPNLTDDAGRMIAQVLGEMLRK